MPAAYGCPKSTMQISSNARLPQVKLLHVLLSAWQRLTLLTAKQGVHLREENSRLRERVQLLEEELRRVSTERGPAG